jgi:hypothetical protein
MLAELAACAPIIVASPIGAFDRHTRRLHHYVSVNWRRCRETDRTHCNRCSKDGPHSQYLILLHHYGTYAKRAALRQRNYVSVSERLQSGDRMGV